MRTTTRLWIGIGCAALVILAACDDAVAPTSDSPVEIAAGVYSIGDLTRARPGTPCADGPYREFDFWVGEWDTFNPDDQQIGTDRIEVLLDGCVVAEHWTSSAGFRGRSINTYDSDTGMWHQTWVSSQPVGIIRMGGGLDDGTMVMDGERVSPFGFTIFDHYEWREIEPGVVEQKGARDVPAFDLHFSFRFVYRQAADFEPAPETPTTECREGGLSEANRQADFLVGSWTVKAENGPIVGESRIETDLSGCLFEERFEAVGGLEAIAFLYYDRIDGRWHRTYMDSEGERIELTGSFEDGALVLTGGEPAPGGHTVELRLTWTADDAGRPTQTLEVSRDGGQTWQPELSLNYLPG